MSDGTEINIRQAKSGDVKAIAVILRGLGWFTYMNEETLTDTERRITRQIDLCHADKSHTVLVAEDRGSVVVGYAAVHWLPYLMLPGSEGYISELFVSESARGKGIGTRLLAAVTAQAMKRGCTRLMLVNRRSRDSYRRGFYSKLGWEERGEFANFVLRLPVKA